MARKSMLVSVQPRVLIWARDTAGRSVAEVAAHLKVKERIIADWEAGQKRPTLIQLRKLARCYKRPLAVFFLPQPPVEVPPPRDFRSALPSDVKHPLSFDTILAIRRARRLQSLAKEMAEGASPENLPRIHLSDNPEETAGKIRLRLGIAIETQFAWSNENVALEKWIRMLEKTGILIFRIGMGKDALAFALADEQFPAIVLNARDYSASRKTFSLFHEFAHLLLNHAGICDMGNEDHLPTEAQAIEVYCNRFAGALLVPKKDLLAHDLVRCELAPCEWSDETLALLAKTFKVSQEVILRRLVILNLADSAFYSRKRAEWQASTLVFEQRKLRRRAYPSRRCVRENGVSFVSLVLNAHRQGTITYADIADYLGVRFKYLPEVEELVGGRH